MPDSAVAFAQPEADAPAQSGVPVPRAGPRARSRPARVGVIESQLADECEAMVHHALGSGMAPPVWILQAVERALTQTHTHRRASTPSSGTEDERPAGGEPGPAPEGPLSEPDRDPSLAFLRLDELARAHAALSRLIAPATPRGLLLLSRGRRQGRLNALGPVRLIRQMLVAVIVLLAAFVLLATSPDINTSSGDIFRSSGAGLLLNELFYLAAGGLGAAFYALFTAYQYIAAGTYDTTYESSYWIRFILGLIAGAVLPSLIPVGSAHDSVTRPLLALLGGFSAAVLYRILQRLVQTVESLTEGDARPVDEARRQLASAQALARAGEDRLALVGDLVQLRDQLAAGQPTEHVSARVQKLIDLLAPSGVLSSAPDSDAPPGPAAGGSPGHS
jgi:hypothetical protein